MLTLIDILNQNRIIPIIVIDNLKHAIPLAKILLASGFKVLEITLRTDCALAAIEKINRNQAIFSAKICRRKICSKSRFK